MAKYSLKRPLAALALVALGFGMFIAMGLLAEYMINVVPVAGEEFSNLLLYSCVGLWVAGGTMICAGIFTPFRFTIVGAILGFLIQSLIAWPYLSDFPVG